MNKSISKTWEKINNFSSRILMDYHSPQPIRDFLVGLMISVLTVSVPALIIITEGTYPKYLQAEELIQ